jgi:hypothetical protein
MKIFSTASILILCISCDFKQKQKSSQSTNSQSSVKMLAVNQCDTSVTGGNIRGVESNYTSVSCKSTLATWVIPFADVSHPNHVCLYGRQLNGNQTETDLQTTSPLDMIKLSDKVLSPKSFSATDVINYFKSEKAVTKYEKLSVIGIETLIAFFGSVDTSHISPRKRALPGGAVEAVISLVEGVITTLYNESNAEMDKIKTQAEFKDQSHTISSHMTLDSKVMAYTLNIAKTNTNGRVCPGLEKAKVLFIRGHNLQ